MRIAKKTRIEGMLLQQLEENEKGMSGTGKRQRHEPRAAGGGDQQSPAATTTEMTATRNAARRQLVAARLAEQLRHAPLDAALTDLDAIVASCNAAGVEFATFEGLDELMQSMEQDEDVGAVIEAEEETGEGKAEALVLVGRYCQLWQRPALALGHFRAAMEAYNKGPLPASDRAAALAALKRRQVVLNQAALGRSQCKATLGQRQEAFEETLHFLGAADLLCGGGPTATGGGIATMATQFVFLLAELAAEQPTPPPAFRIAQVRTTP